VRNHEHDAFAWKGVIMIEKKRKDSEQQRPLGQDRQRRAAVKALLHGMVP